MDHKESFLRYLLVEKRYSPRTIESYRNDINQFSGFLESTGHSLLVSDINSQDIRAWIVSLMENGCTAVSVHRKISCLRSFYRWLTREGLVNGNPMEKVILPKKKKKLPVFVAEDSLEKLLDGDYFGDDYRGVLNRTIIELLYVTGMRRAELIGLKTGDIDLGSRVLKVTGKRNKQRIIPILAAFSETLDTYMKIRAERYGVGAGDWLFITDTGRRIYDKYVYNVVRAYLEQVTTIEKKSPHVLRHSFATHMLNRGADLNSIKEILGHANLSATQVYTHNTFEKLKKVYKQAHPRA
ncbi:MAG: tyrosine-type recombinase/integrase [Bacteroidales bacterium]